MLNPAVVFRSVYENVTPVYGGNEKTFLRLYDNCNSLLGIVNGQKKDAGPLLYAFQNLGTLEHGRPETPSLTFAWTD